MHIDDIATQVFQAQKDAQLADEFIKQYMPFIKSETAKFMKHSPSSGDDELSIAMFAFYEAVLGYEKRRGPFLAYASLTIKHRLIDFYRKEQKNKKVISLDASCDTEEGKTLMDSLDSGEDIEGTYEEREAAQKEIAIFVKDLEEFGITLSEVAENCPKQERTLKVCLETLDFAKANPEILTEMVATHKLPITRLARNSNSVKKKLERHRKYMVAIMLAYTNGFEIIRDHLKQLGGQKGGDICDI